MNLNKKAIIFGIKGYKLTKKEKLFLKKSKPLGLILFSRNIKNIQQLKKLTYDIKHIFKDKKYPILIDEEGGNVSRLSKIIDFSNFSHEYFGKLFKSNKNLGLSLRNSKVRNVLIPAHAMDIYQRYFQCLYFVFI